MTNFDAMYTNPIPWNDGGAGETSSYKGGAWGTTDYYNGAANRMIPPVLEQVNTKDGTVPTIRLIMVDIM